MSCEMILPSRAALFCATTPSQLRAILLPALVEGLAIVPRNEALTISIGIISSMVAGLHFLACDYDARHPIWSAASKAHDLFIDLSNCGADRLTADDVIDRIEVIAGTISRLVEFQPDGILRTKITKRVSPICAADLRQ